MQHLITSMGEILIDFLPIQEDERTVGFRMHAGGSLLNVAVSIARLGAPSALATKTALDPFGQFLRNHVAAQGIDTRFALQTTAQNTLAFVTFIDGEPNYNFYTTNRTAGLLQFDEIPAALFDETTIFHYGDLNLLRVTAPDAVVATAERLKGRALLSFDPNVRTSLMGDETEYRALLQRAMDLADLVKISAVDMAWIIPGRPIEDAAADLLANGAALVVVTLGGDGVLALRESNGELHSIRLPGFKVDVVDTVGAGDSFSGGLLTSLAELGVGGREALMQVSSDQLETSLRFAAAVSAINCTRAGADPPDRATVEAFLAQQV